MIKQSMLAAALLSVSALSGACSTSQETSNTNSNANTQMAAQTITRPGPDNSDITTITDANGVKTETRTFRDNPRVARVVVTTRNGTRTTHVYATNGEDKEVGTVENALDATGDAIANAAGFVADKTVDGVKKGVEVGKDVGKTVGEKTGETAGKVADKTADGAKAVADKTATGAKKVGKAIKNAVTP